MNTLTITQKKEIQPKNDIEQLKIKAIFWDEFMEFVEDKYFGYLMGLTEKEKNIPLLKARKMLR